MKKRILSAFMALALCLTLLPAPAWAGETGAPKGGAAQIGNTVYSTLPEAVNAAKDGDTIKLLADYKTAEGAGGEGESDLTITKSVTLDLNGYEMDGFRVAQVNGEGATLPSGNLTVEDASAAKTGKVTGEIELLAGNLTINGGTIGNDRDGIWIENGNLIVNGGTMVFLYGSDSGTVTIAGGTVKNARFGPGFEITVTGGSGHTGLWDVSEGKWNISGGEFGEVMFKTASPAKNAPISGGTFGKITRKNLQNNTETPAPISGLLADGYAFYQKTNSGEYDGYVNLNDTITSLENVQVKGHIHNLVNGVCTVCGAQMKAQDTTGKYYLNLQDAFAGVADGGTVTMLTTLTDDRISFCCDAEGKPVDKTVTLMMNGKSLSFDGASPLYIQSGKLIIGDEATISQTEEQTGQPAVWVDNHDQDKDRGTLEFKGKATITGGLLIQNWGKLVGGLKEGTIITSNGTYSVSVERSTDTYDNVLGLLGDGLAFAKYDENAENKAGAIVNGNVKQLTENVIVVAHTHNIVNGSCACGRQFEASVTAKDGVSYYDTIDSAFAAAHKGDTVTLLADITNRGGRGIFVSGGPYTLDLNGHRIEAGIDLMVGDMDNSEVLLRGELTVKDSSTDNAGYVQYLKLWNGDLTVESGSFHWIIENTPDSVGTITITGGTAETVTHCSPNVTFRLSGGTFDRISISSTCGENVFPSDLLADGYAYANKNSGAIQNGEGYSDVSDVTVVKHDHTWNDGVCACGVSCAHSEMNSTTGKCSVCGKLLAVASVKTSGGTVTCYRDIHEAFDAAKVSNDGTLTLLQDVTLNNEDSIYISPDSGDYRFTVDWNGHTLSGNTWRSLLTFADNTNVTLTDSSEAKTGGVCNNNMGAAVYLSIGGSNSVEITGGTYTPQVTTDERCYGTVRISGGVFNNPEDSGQSTALYDAKGGKLAALLADGVTLARDKDGHNLLDVYSNSLTGQGTFYVVAHTHTIDESTNKCACGYTCSHTAVDENGNCTVCKKPMAAMVTKGGESRAYAALNDALGAADGGGTVKLLADAGEITIGSPLKLDLNGKTAAKLTVTGDVTLASLLPEGCAFKSGSTWITDLTGKELTTVSMAKIPIKSMDYPIEMSMEYGGAGTLLVTVKKETDTGAVSFQWYKVEDGKETAVGNATTKNQFNLSALKLPAGQHTFRFSATCDGYKKMSQDIAVTVQRASISASRITPPTAQENLTYTGQEQALITAGSVTSGGTMQYSLTENGTYSQDIPTGTDAGTYTVWYRVIGDANHNDTAPDSVVVSIGKKPLTLTKVTAVSKPYDGTTNAGITSVTFDGVTLIRGTDYNVTASFEDASVGNNKMVTAAVTLIGQAAKNYALEQSSFPTTGNITKAAAPAAEAGSLTITNGLHETYSLDLSTLLPKLTAPCDYGAIIYDKKVDAHLGVGTFVTLVNGKTGELTLEANRSDTDEGQFGTITVTISTSNYQDITLTIHVSAKNRITPTGTPTLSKNAITYGNALNTIALSGKLHDNVNNVDVDGTFEWVDGTHIPVVGNGTYAAEWIFEPTDTEKYLTVSGRSNITVEKAQQYGKVSMDDYVYGETPSTPSLTDRTGDGSVTYYYTTTDSNSGGIKWENIQADTLNAGTYYMYAELGETENYGSFTTACVKFRVVRAMPTYTTPTGLTAIYGQTLADVTLPDGWSWMDSSESVGGASTAAKTFQARFTPTDAVNYNTVENIKLDVTVNKANGGSLKTVELTQKHTDTSEHTYTPDWAGLPAGQDWTFSSEASIVLPKQDFAAGGKLLTYAISSGTAGDKITLTLKASCDNYEDFTITLTITLTEKDDQKPLTITGAGSVVYGQTLTLTTTGGSGTGTVTYRIDTAHSTGEATIDPNTGVLTPAKVGSVSVVATKAGDNDYNDVTSAPFVLMIKPATPTGEPNYTKITTSGKTLKDAALTTKGSTLNPSDGNLEWVDDKGEPLPDDTTVKANTTYKWRFTPDDDNYTTLTGEVELYHKSSSDGGWYDSYYTIKATAGAGGSISPSGNVSVREGRDQTFTITPDKGYAVANVKIDGKSIGAVKSYTFENVSRTHTIEVIFMKANGNPQTGVFVDVATGSYYEDAVDWAVENGITKGTDDTHFSPDGICTRAQAVTFLWRTAGSPASKTSTMPFTDVPVGSYYYDAVLWAVENGITKGTSDTTFSPNMTCSRAQIVAFLWRSEKSPAAGTANPFADVKSTAYYADAVLWAVKENITKGTTSTTFSPDADCSRAQIVTFLWRCKK